MDFLFVVRVAEQATRFLADEVTAYPPLPAPAKPGEPYFLVFHRAGKLLRRNYFDLYSRDEMKRAA